MQSILKTAILQHDPKPQRASISIAASFNLFDDGRIL